MVYRGKPSAGCGECRKRKNRCDQATPACGQCVKANRTCPGYRNMVDLMFLDESTKIVEKNRLKTTKSQESSSGVSPHRRHRRIVQQAEPPIHLTDVTLYQPLDDVALNYFMANYVGNDHLNAQFDYLPDLYRHSNSAPTMRETVKALGMAGFAKATHRPKMIQPAIKSYISALREVNTALSSPALAAEDSTLASVLLLAMFEVMIMPRGTRYKNLTKHLNGAMSIAALHVQKQKPTDYSIRLMRNLFQGVIMNCWVQNIPLPKELLLLKEHLGRVVTPESLYGEFLDVVMMLINFRHTIVERGITSPSVIISQAIAFDTRLQDFGDALPKESQFQILPNSTKTQLTIGTFDAFYHIYPRNFTAHFWNNMCSTRIRLHDLVSKQCRLQLSSPDRDPAMDAHIVAQLEASEKLIRTLAMEMCAAIPQLSEYLDQLQSFNPQDSGTFDSLYLTIWTTPASNLCPLSSTVTIEENTDMCPSSFPSPPFPLPENLQVSTTCFKDYIWLRLWKS